MRSASSFESTTNPLGLLLEGAPPARLLEAHLDAGPQLPELIDAAALLRAEEHAAASALLDDLLAGTTDAAEIRSDALRVDDATLRVRARARYLLLVAGHGAGSPDDLAGLRRRMAETEQVADEFARYTEGRQARLWSAEIAYRIWTLTGEREDCRNAERSLRATIARLENDPALTGHLDTLLSGLDC